MIFKNPNSKRINLFNELYNSNRFKFAKDDCTVYMPLVVDIELTNVCNNKCLFCGQQAMTRKQGFMEWHVFVKAVSECSENCIPIRLIRCGEPTMHPEFDGFIKYASSEIPIHLTTNGLNSIDAATAGYLDSLIFSFQGATKEQYELMRNNNRYDELVENIMKVVKDRGDNQKPFIHISSTMTAYDTQPEIEAFVDKWSKIVDSVGIGKTNLSFVPNNPLVEKMKGVETIIKKYMPCNDVYQRLNVDWDGKVSACCLDYDGFLTVGDINEQSLGDIWNSSEKLKLIRRMLDLGMHKSLTFCSTCFHTYDNF